MTTPEERPIVRGALIVLEGLDRSGKTTQVELLEKHFLEQGKKVKVMRFPRYVVVNPSPSNVARNQHPPDRSTPIGQMIDSYLKSQLDMDDHAIHLLFSANRWEAARTMTALLSAGTTILCDRYYHSGIVYSAAKRNPSLTLSWARAPEVGLPRPDLVLFLDLDEAQARARGGWGGEVYERAETQRRVKELFWGLSLGQIGTVVVPNEGEVAVGPPTSETMTGLETRFRQEEEDLHVVDAGAGVEEVAAEVWEVVRRRVEEVERGEVGGVARRVS